MRPILVPGPMDILLDNNVSIFNVDIRLNGLTVTGALEDADKSPVFFALPAAGSNGIINLRDPVRILRFAGAGTATVNQQGLAGPGVDDLASTVVIPPAVLAARSAAATAPTPGNLQYQAQTVSYLGPNEFPDLSFDRHYTSGAGIGTADFFTKVKASFYPTSWESLGGPTNGENDGSNAAFWTAWKSSMGTVQNSNPVYVGFQTPSRYLWIPSQSGRQAQLRVDGKLLPINTPITWPSNNNMAKIDLGSVGAGAGRKIVLQGLGIHDLWLSELSVTSGAALAPYDWMADTGRVSAAFFGDSYQLGGDYSLVGLPFVQYIAELSGFGATIQSSIGGTGYVTNGGSADYPDLQSAIRQTIVTRESPTVVVVQAGINDPGGAGTNAAMLAVYTALRAALPNALIVAQTAWSPSQTAGQAGGGKYQSMRTNLYSVMAGLSGPWIIIDNLAGTWLTSSGKSRSVAYGPWQTGDGNAGAPTGTGNGDTWVSADGTHPTALGYKGLAELFAMFLKEALIAF